MRTFYLRRIAHTSRSTRGLFFAPDGVTTLCQALERGPSNPDGHVRIPAGTYKLILHQPSEFDASLTGKLGSAYHGVIRLVDVPGRTAIEIHPANEVEELKGCIAPGDTWHTDDYGEFCVWSSMDACKAIYPLITEAILNEGAQLQVEDTDKSSQG
jgi:hypothetical protein